MSAPLWIGDVLPVHDRPKALSFATVEQFLAVEPTLRKIDGHWDYVCDRERERRGLFTATARNWNCTLVQRGRS